MRQKPIHKNIVLRKWEATKSTRNTTLTNSVKDHGGNFIKIQEKCVIIIKSMKSHDKMTLQHLQTHQDYNNNMIMRTCNLCLCIPYATIMGQLGHIISKLTTRPTGKSDDYNTTKLDVLIWWSWFGGCGRSSSHCGIPVRFVNKPFVPSSFRCWRLCENGEN